MGETFAISKLYEESLDINIKKSKGVYYTPKIIVDYILNNTIKNHDIHKNPIPKILDISCGCGNFFIRSIWYFVWFNRKKFIRIKGIIWWWVYKLCTIHNHIITNCIYGYDIDAEAVNILKQGLKDKGKGLSVDKFNIYCEDSLKIKLNNKFDYIIGNPPYIGHKNLDSDYSARRF